MALFTTSLFRRFRVNYFKALKLYLVKCWRKDRAILPLPIVELGFYPFIPRLCRAGYLLYAFIINGILFLNQGRLYHLALYSESYCHSLIVNPFSKEFDYKLNPKSNFSKRFNELNYKTINNKCK